MNRGSQRPSVLIVDDTPENIDILTGILRNDYHLLVANSGERALAICRRHQPDLVLLDVMMPGLDGYQVCRQLKQDPLTSDIPVIFVTAASRDQDEVDGLAAGAVDFLGKPVRPPIVAARVRTHVELKQQRDMLRKLSQMDGLTGIANRRTFEEALGRESRRCTRRQSSLALLMVDIDSFRAFNEAYGHMAGDRCLRRVAAALASSLDRSGDLAARLAGDRFACILPDTNLAGLTHVAGRISRDAANLRIAHTRSETGGYLSLSMAGLVAVPGPDWVLPNLLPRVEALMVMAKRAGGARAALANLDTAATPAMLVFDGSHDFDAETGLRRTGGIPERYRSFLARFVAEHADDGHAIAVALAETDRAGARRRAHTLASVAGSLGASALAAAAEAAANRLREEGTADDELMRLQLEMESALRHVYRLLNDTPMVADAAPSAPATGARRLIKRLATLIADYDCEALWLFEDNQPLLAEHLPAEAFRRLAAALAHFDYDSAFTALHGIAMGDG